MTANGKPGSSRSMRFSCFAPTARAVFLAGTFNGWNPEATPLAKDAQGGWGGTVDLVPGHYEFKYVVDGAWCCEPGLREPGRGCPSCVPNPFGTMNCKMEVR